MAGVAELARMLFAANTILERGSSAVGLSKRAALALGIMYLKDDSQETMTNTGLQDHFVGFKVSTDLSAQKDASAAKSELLRAKYIEIQGSVSMFALTAQGRDAVSIMYEAMTKAVDELGLSDDERSVLRKLVGFQEAKPPAKLPASAASARTVRRKSS